MTASRLYPLFTVLVLATGLAACGGKAYVYEPVDTDRFLPAAERQADGAIRVSAVVPGREETARIFGIDLYEQGIQPVWLQIENAGDALARYAPVSTDPEYFAPLEVAYMNRSGYSDEARDAMNERFRNLAMPRYIEAGETRSGFVYTHADPGAKGFNVDVFSAGESRYFTFLLRVPGFEPDYARLNLREMYAEDEVTALAEEALREAIRMLPCCAADRPGEDTGEPLNVVLIGEGEELLRALLRSGWRETSVEEAEGIAPQYLYGRKQDGIFRYAAIGGDSFYELRFWKAPFTFGNDDVYVGQARHFYRWIGTVTRLDADVDNARNFAAQKFLYGQTLEASAWLAGREVVPATSFWNALISTPYFTDGYRTVMWLSAEPVSMLDVDVRDWDKPPRWMQP
ncbi:MAG TPA: LssY C-terminal domain-containing protein [Woeseiaceae bacterium]|nr:LssY C-terminal domain-containing protein [Woeseiaceae bacterium]